MLCATAARAAAARPAVRIWPALSRGQRGGPRGGPRFDNVRRGATPTPAWPPAAGLAVRSSRSSADDAIICPNRRRAARRPLPHYPHYTGSRRICMAGGPAGAGRGGMRPHAASGSLRVFLAHRAFSNARTGRAKKILQLFKVLVVPSAKEFSVISLAAHEDTAAAASPRLAQVAAGSMPARYGVGLRPPVPLVSLPTHSKARRLPGTWSSSPAARPNTVFPVMLDVDWLRSSQARLSLVATVAKSTLIG